MKIKQVNIEFTEFSVFRKFWTWNLLLLCIFAVPSKMFASNTTTTLASLQQTHTVTGKVSDADGVLLGVTILVKNTTRGAVTDFDGGFTIEASSGETLVFSYLGYITKEIKITEETKNLNVVLESDVSGLDEVVVVGYTTRKRGELTGSVSTLNSGEVENTTNRDVAKSLSGKVSGLIVSDRGGYPGSNDDITMLIRGQATLGNNAPLILIDGIVAGQGSFSQLAPQDIESLSILKDGAAAIYGARAANGVILVTTKRGKIGKPKVNFSTAYSVAQLSSQPRLMTSEQFAIYRNEVADRNGTPLPYTQDDINKYAAGNDPINYPSTDWYDLTFADSAPEMRTSVSISGGSENVKYFVSGDNLQREGMFASGDLDFKQNQVRSNIDINLSDNFKVGVDLTGRFGKTNEPGVDAGYIYKHIYTNLPTEVGVYPNGLPGWGGENGGNPLVMSSNESGFVRRTDNDLRGRFSFNWDLDDLITGLSVNGYAGVRRMNNDEKSWYTPWTVYTYQEGTDTYVPSTGFSQRGNQRILQESFWKFDELLLNSTIRYSNTFNDAHSVSGFVGYEQITSQSRNFWAERRGFPTSDHSELFAGSDEGQQSYGTSQEAATVSYFGSFSYDFKKKYFIDFTLRHDGSSNFSPNKRFGTFPGVAVSWALNEEGFLQNVNWINALKIRGSWAKMGNDRIAPFQYLTRYNYGGPVNAAQPNYYVFGETGVSYNGYTSANVPNPDVTWETAYMKNVGLSFSLFNSKLSGDFNYFHQKREGILVTRDAAIPDAAGLILPDENIGKVNNFGYEIEMQWRDQIGAVDYNLGFNFTQARNEVVYLAEAEDTPDGLKREGNPMNSYVVYPTNGIFRDQDHVNNTAAKLPGTVEGEPVYVDTNEDGVISSADRIRTFTSNVPEIQYGIHGGIQYKNVNFNFLFQGQAEAEILVFFDQNGANPDYLFNERWTPDNRDAQYPRAFGQGDPYSGNQSDDVENFEGADFWLKDASFLRLKEIELGYTLGKDKIKIGDMKLFVRGFNLFTMFSDIYDMGLDPESTGYNNFRGATYPSLKSFTFGVNFSF
ncbi:SusC/RagA family TonB-linked outer membrane protein [Pseudotamlana carrageenivorans]|uniref:TonB-dependent receptor n=1 Tax=Pseudotamlana carrageenivorans TaxID=2069432 RepID=A0A2I7SHV9_9FLAO|nr:TonB-dependent receptor [Tamlana carrageenivorans]AUS05482.1 TonB-dependent receptor [Tamlana carrageenivorans]